MIKQTTFFAILIALAQLSTALNTAPVNFHPKIDGDSLLNQIPAPEQMLHQIISVIGANNVFELKQAPVQNLEASISHRKMMIIYNPEYIDWLNKVTHDKWAVMTLLAHEIGHHLNGHTKRNKGSSPKVELEADEFAGYILNKLGATLQDAQKVMNYIARINASITHPGRYDRKQAIQTGWDKASNEWPGTKDRH